MGNSQSPKIVFLDRDGTINKDVGPISKSSDFFFLENVTRAMREIRDAGFLIAVVTNQSAIAAGIVSEADLLDLHQYMTTELRSEGVTIDAVVFCPHSSKDNCDCRKPEVGMAKQVERHIGLELNYAKSWMVGDKISDVQFGKRLGLRTGLIKSRYWSDKDLETEPTAIGKSLSDISEVICHDGRSGG